MVSKEDSVTSIADAFTTVLPAPRRKSIFDYMLFYEWTSSGPLRDLLHRSEGLGAGRSSGFEKICSEIKGKRVERVK